MSREADRYYLFPCGCATRDARDGPVSHDCGKPDCYRRTRPENLVQVNRATRRAQSRKK